MISRVFVSRLVRWAVFLLVLTWCAGFTFPYLFITGKYTAAAFPFIKYCYSVVCHQLPVKSFAVNDFHLLVCARCTGIYTGALAVSLALLFININPPQKLKLFLISLVPVIADAVLTSSGLYSYNKWIAFTTGLFSGSVVFIYILSLLEKYFAELISNNG